MKKVFFIFVAALCVCCCAPKKSKTVVTPTLLRVPEYMIEQHLVDYISDAVSLPLAEGQRKMVELFEDMEAEEASDSTKHAFLRISELVSKYLYDPNSPLRDEDVYLPFVQRLAESSYTSDDIRPAYVYEARMCALNPRESKAADFVFRNLKGRDRHLYDVQADYTLLFFSNPGCEACKEIVQTVRSAVFAEKMIKDGELAVVNVYIDEDLDAWKDYVDYYPASWLNGYDPKYIIRGNTLYNVRAIPSVYLLDSQKTVMLKDADIVKVLNTLYNIKNQ